LNIPPQDLNFIDLITSLFRKYFPADLLIIAIWLILSISTIYLPLLNSSPLRIIFALPLVLFIPGYCLIAALFPGKEDIDGIERIALSFGLSIAIVPLIGLGLNYTPWGIRLDPIVISIVLFTCVMIIIAIIRRASLPKQNRFFVPFRSIFQSVTSEFYPSKGSGIDKVLSIFLLISIITAIGTTIFVIVIPKEGEKFTEFFILGENQMAADYPDYLKIGENYPMYIGIGNHEFRNVNYTIETYLIQMDNNEAMNTSTISRMDRLDRIPVSLSHNTTRILPYNLSAPDSGYNRAEFLLFNESIPEESVKGMDRINASYRDLHLWVTISK